MTDERKAAVWFGVAILSGIEAALLAAHVLY